MRIIGLSLTHNDQTKGWLEEWYKANSTYLDRWIILDDKSSDDTFKELKNLKEKYLENDVDTHFYQTIEPIFKTHENKIREILWNKCRQIARPGDWVIVLDSDEILTPQFGLNIKQYLSKDHRLLFKKLEIWDEDKIDYRVDGLWSNFFSRMFPFKDEEWGYYEKGFHHPQIPAYTQSMKKINTCIPILHLAYYEEKFRQNKLKFMTENPQQKKDDINFKHLQTINTKPKLKSIYDYNNDYNNDSTNNIIIDMRGCFCISDKILNLIEKTKHINKHIILHDSNLFIREQLKDINVPNLSIHTFYSLNNSLELLLKEMDLTLHRYTLYINALRDFRHESFMEAIATDKDFVFDNKLSMMYVRNKYLELIRMSKFNNPYFELQNIIMRLRKTHYIWIVGEDFNPFPMNCGEIQNI
jgi:hypothetical protein